MPRGGWLREVRRWACCGLRRTGGPSPGFGARFYHIAYTVPLCWVWGAGIAALWSCHVEDSNCTQMCERQTFACALKYFILTY